jgi:hypothetical protein
LPPEFLGVALGRFRPEVERTLAEARRWKSGELPAFPGHLIPRVALGG